MPQIFVLVIVWFKSLYATSQADLSELELGRCYCEGLSISRRRLLGGKGWSSEEGKEGMSVLCVRSESMWTAYSAELWFVIFK